MHEHVEIIPLETDPTNAEDRRCAEILLESLRAHPGVRHVRWDAGKRELTLRYDPDRIGLQVVRGIAQDLGLRLQGRHSRCTLHVRSAGCRECTSLLERELAALPGVVHVAANVPGGTIVVEYETDSGISPARLEQELRRHGYRVWHRARGAFERVAGITVAWWRNPELVLATLALLFLVAGLAVEHLSTWPRWVAVGFYALAYLSGGYYGVLGAMTALRQRVLDIDFLMIVSALGAAYLDHWAEGATLLFLFSLSGALETFAMDRTRHAIEKLMALRPKEAIIRRNGTEVRVPLEEIEVGDEVIVRPGESIPVDGEVVEGVSAVDQSAITGESIPALRRSGDKVLAGSINTEGSLVIRATKRAADSTLARIIQLVEEAQGERAPTQRLIDRYSQPYATGVVVAVLLYLAVGTLGLRWPFEEVLYRAMTLLVVASPCALVISTPASILSAIAAGARNGVLFKGGMHLENMARLRIVAFDKTGTLTYGKPRVTDVIPAPGFSHDELLRLTASVERRSEHPLARSIVEYAHQAGLELDEPEEFRALVGRGVRARFNGQHVYIGNGRLMEEIARDVPPELQAVAQRLHEEGKSIVWVSNSRVVGLLAVADVVRPQATETVRALKELGVEKVVMLSGDNRLVAQAIAAQVGVDEVYAELLPEDKVEIVKRLEQEGATGMVGDGINDAPAMALATTGIAMGAAGTDVALETADVVLMADDLSKLPFAVALSRRARTIVLQNLVFSLGVMLALVIATLTVGIPLPLGVIGHEGSTLVVVSNGLRLLRSR